MPFSLWFPDDKLKNSMAARIVSPKKLESQRACIRPEAMCLALTLLVAKLVLAADSPASNPTGPV